MKGTTILLALSIASSTASPIAARAAIDDAQNATAFSILYGYPLASYVGAVKPILQSVGVNQLENNRYLETAAATGSANQVVDPNEDTVYSAMVFDLAKQNVVVTVPEIPKDRFALWSYYDPFGDNFANTGTQNLDEAGEYLLRYSPEATHFGVTRASDDDCYVAYVDSPTPFGIMDIRWLVSNYSSYASIHRWQNETKIRSVPKPAKQQLNTTLIDVLESVPRSTKSPAKHLLQLLAKFAPWCLPTTISDRPRVSSELRTAGISNGTFTPMPHVNYTAANVTALEAAAASFEAPGRITNETNGWAILNPGYIGTYGTDYGIRASVAITGYLGLAAPNALYPTFNNGSTSGGLSAATTFHLGANESLL